MKKNAKNTIVSDDHEITITNRDTILFPADNITKGDLVDYYQRIAPYMLPYMKDRLITMQRYPSGIAQEGFYQKDAGDYFPAWIPRKKVRKKDDGTTNYVVGGDAATLIYLANQAVITPHLWLSRVGNLRKPDRMIFDLDPSKEDQFPLIIATAKKLKTILESGGLHPFVMTTGSRGLHVVIPLDGTSSFEAVRHCAHTIAQQLVDADPENLTLEIRKDKRQGRLFIDTLRNSYGATGVAPYAVRVRDGAPVATPIAWDEVAPGLTPDQWNIKNIFKRLARIEDPWKNSEKYKGNIKEACKKMKKAFDK